MVFIINVTVVHAQVALLAHTAGLALLDKTLHVMNKFSHI